MLALDDPKWGTLENRGCASSIPKTIERLLETPSDQAAFTDLWPYLCSEDTAWPAAFAAVPYVVQIAERLPPAERVEHLFFVGYVAMCAEDIPTDLTDAYQAALVEALPLLLDTLRCDLSASDTRYAVAALSALKGLPEMGLLVSNLDCGCPHCGEELCELDE